MSTAEIGTLVVIISVFLTFAVILGWASRHGGLSRYLLSGATSGAMSGRPRLQPSIRLC